MYRVITVRLFNQGTGRSRVVCKGPLHPSMEHANHWAEYFRNTGDYDDVRVEDSSPIRAKGSRARP